MILPSAYMVNIGYNDLLLKVNFFLKKKLDYTFLNSIRPLGECSQGTILVSLLFLSVSLAISVRVLHFNNSLKSESSGALPVTAGWVLGK